MIFGAAAQFGIFFTFCAASMFSDLNDAASIGIIGAADGPIADCSISKAQFGLSGAIMVAAYSYMALVRNSAARNKLLYHQRSGL